MAAKCINCGDPLVWVAEYSRYHHRDSGSTFCGSSHMKARRK